MDKGYIIVKLFQPKDGEFQYLVQRIWYNMHGDEIKENLAMFVSIFDAESFCWSKKENLKKC